MFGELGARCLHTGGIFAALSPATAALAEEAMRAARAHGTRVSYDLNYRASLWQAGGGWRAAREVNRRLAPLVDIMLGNEEDFTACLGFEVPGAGTEFATLAADGFRAMITELTATYDTISVAATTLRAARSATINDWGAIAWSADDGFGGGRPRDPGSDPRPRRRRRQLRVRSSLRIARALRPDGPLWSTAPRTARSR